MLFTELALQTGKNLINYYPTLIPCLYVFYYESLMSLQVSLRLELPVLGQDAHLCCCQLWRAANFLQRCEPQYSGEDKKSHRAGRHHPFSLNAFRDLSLLTFFEHFGEALALCAVALGSILSLLGNKQWGFAIRCLLFVPFTKAVVTVRHTPNNLSVLPHLLLLYLTVEVRDGPIPIYSSLRSFR